MSKGDAAKKWIGFGLRFVPYIGTVIQSVEAIKEAKGPDKLAKVELAVANGIEAVEFGLDKDVLKDEQVAVAMRAYIGTYVALQNAIAAAKAGTAALKDAKTEPAL